MLHAHPNLKEALMKDLQANPTYWNTTLNFNIRQKNWFCVFELNKFIKLPDRLPDYPAAGVGTPGQQSCKQKSSNVVGFLKILRNRFQRLVSFFVINTKKNTQNVNLIPVLVSKIKILKKKEKNDYNVWKYGMVELVALEAFRAVARTSPGRTRLSIMHSLNRGPTNGT